MLICEECYYCDELLEDDGEWELEYEFFTTENEMREFIESHGDDIEVIRACKLEDIEI